MRCLARQPSTCKQAALTLRSRWWRLCCSRRPDVPGVVQAAALAAVQLCPVGCVVCEALLHPQAQPAVRVPGHVILVMGGCLRCASPAHPSKLRCSGTCRSPSVHAVTGLQPLGMCARGTLTGPAAASGNAAAACCRLKLRGSTRDHHSLCLDCHSTAGGPGQHQAGQRPCTDQRVQAPLPASTATRPHSAEAGLAGAPPACARCPDAGVAGESGPSGWQGPGTGGHPGLASSPHQQSLHGEDAGRSHRAHQRRTTCWPATQPLACDGAALEAMGKYAAGACIVRLQPASDRLSGRRCRVHSAGRQHVHLRP